MSQQIRDLVLRHVPTRYRSEREVARAVDGITAEIVRLRDTAAAQIKSAARTKGISEEEVNEVLYNCGLAERPAPQPAATSGGQGALEAQFASLVEFARRHGYRG